MSAKQGPINISHGRAEYIEKPKRRFGAPRAIKKSQSDFRAWDAASDGGLGLLPIILDEVKIRVGVAGLGDGLQRRLEMLSAAGFGAPELITEALPGKLDGLAVLFVAGLDETESQKFAGAARAAGVLVNVEDRPELCDFHVPAQLRRGELLLTISTSGRSPGLARILREYLETLFGPEWDGIVEAVAKARQEWREQGLPPDEVSRRTRAMMQWLK